MAGKRVAVLSPEGQFGTVDEADVEAVERAGGRVLTKQQLAERKLDEEYEKASTVQKVTGALSMAGPLGQALSLATDGVRPPVYDAYKEGVARGVTAGLGPGIYRQALDEVSPGAGAKYAERVEDLRTAHPATSTAGEIAGVVGGAVAGNEIAPLGVLGRAGTVAETAALGATGNLAARGVGGRALSTAIGLGARGATEGAIYGAATQVGEDLLGDKQLAADKVFASAGAGALFGAVGGAALGGTGSLAASGVRGAANAGTRGLARVMGRAERGAADVAAKADAVQREGAALAKGVADDAVSNATKVIDDVKASARAAADDAVASARTAAELTGTKPAQEMASFSQLVDQLSSKQTQKGWAYEQAWKAVGAGQGLQSTTFAKKAAKFLPNGTKDVGEVIMRKGIINADEGVMNAAKHGTPADLLPRITAELETVGARLGEMTEASGGRVAVGDIAAGIRRVRAQYQNKAGFEHVVRAIDEYADSLYRKLGMVDPALRIKPKGSRVTAPLRDVLEQRKALDELVWEASPLEAKGRVAALREVRSEIESAVVKTLDESSGKMPGQLAAEYKALKKDFFALSIAKEAASDSAARMSKAASLGMRDMLFGGSNVLASVGHKVVRERGNAAAAVLLHRMADMGTLTKAIRAMDDQIGRAAKGLLAAPSKRPLPERTPAEPVRVRAERAMKAVAAAQADPGTYIERVIRQTEALSSTAPEVSSAVAQRMVQTLSFLSGKVPVAADRDPLDPHPAPRMSEAQAAEFARYAWYTEKPSRFFAEVEHGKITPEGAEVAKALMPSAFAELQAKTMEAIAAHMAAGRTIPFEQRLKIGNLLDIPADPSQRLGHASFLQENVLPFTDTNEPDSVAPAPKRPLQIPTQQSALDSLEANGPGRR